jgi:hypothetical protein
MLFPLTEVENKEGTILKGEIINSLLELRREDNGAKVKS